MATSIALTIALFDLDTTSVVLVRYNWMDRSNSIYVFSARSFQRIVLPRFLFQSKLEAPPPYTGAHLEKNPTYPNVK